MKIFPLLVLYSMQPWCKKYFNIILTYNTNVLESFHDPRLPLCVPMLELKAFSSEATTTKPPELVADYIDWLPNLTASIVAISSQNSNWVQESWNRVFSYPVRLGSSTLAHVRQVFLVGLAVWLASFKYSGNPLANSKKLTHHLYLIVIGAYDKVFTKDLRWPKW